ncbi:cell wall hydrolase [Maritimibacter sp. 55A14]|nr:cell wall hydrolase [Maritimibacter sp. 55A14]
MLGAEAAAFRGLSSERLARIATPVDERTNARSVLGNFLQQRSAPDARTFNYTRAALEAVPQASGGKQWACLTEALYFEARGESVAGQFAVAEVIMNRVDAASFPDTVCRVVNQGTGKRYQCQFTYTCDGYSEVIREKGAYESVGKVARLVLDGVPRTLTGGATYYHTKAVSPRWARRFTRTATIGVHYFYRDPTRVSQN